MEKLSSSSKLPKVKDKAKKQIQKSSKKKKSDCGQTCSTFLSELTRRFSLKKKQEEDSPRNVVQAIIESLTNALPIKFSSNKTSKSPSLTVNNSKVTTNEQMATIPNKVEKMEIVAEPPIEPSETKFPRMPLINSDVLKPAKRPNIPKAETATNTGNEHDIATEITKHVNTLRKISLIADEFNQKTARNLKEIVNSVQEDLIRKLEEIRTEQQASAS